MPTLTLESGPCPQCQTENSRHIDNCHTCGAPLPWNGSESKRVAILQAEEAARTDISLWLRAAWLGAGALLFLVGVFFWCGNVMGFFPTFPGVGYITMLIGGGVCKKANDMT